MRNKIHPRPPINVQEMVEKCLLLIALFGVGLYLLISSLGLRQSFYAGSSRSVTLPAVISRVEEGTDADYNRTINAYVSYEYGGKTYEAHYEHSSGLENGLNRENPKKNIGKTVQITVDIQDASVTIEGVFDSFFFRYCGGIVAWTIGALVFMKRCRKTYVETYGVTSWTAATDDLDEARRFILWIPVFLFSVASVIFSHMLNGMNVGMSIVSFWLGVAAAPVWIVMLVFYIVRIVRESQFQRYCE